MKRVHTVKSLSNWCGLFALTWLINFIIVIDRRINTIYSLDVACIDEFDSDRINIKHSNNNDQGALA